MKETFEMKKTLFRSEMELKLDTGGDLHGWICSYWRTNNFIFRFKMNLWVPPWYRVKSTKGRVLLRLSFQSFNYYGDNHSDKARYRKCSTYQNMYRRFFSNTKWKQIGRTFREEPVDFCNISLISHHLWLSLVDEWLSEIWKLVFI